jgi:thioredoxin-related protein
MKISLVIFLSIIILASNEWVTDLDAAKEMAARENKYVLLNFSGSDWCAPCIKMKTEVFETQSFLSLAEKHLVLVRADFPRSKKNQLSKDQTKRNEAMAERYNPAGKFPLTLLLDAKGKVIKEWDGYVFGSQDKFMSDLNKITSQRQ